MTRPTLTIVAGATGVGKTAVAVALARRIGGAVISADSQQVYRGLNIGSAKPTPAECGAVEYTGVDLVDFDEQFDLARFLAYAEDEIDRHRREGKQTIVAGGTGLYIQGLLEGVFEGPAADPELRRGLFARLEAEGASALYAELRAVDPEAAAGIHPNDHVRLVRALEVRRQTGRRISELRRAGRAAAPRWPFHLVVLDRPRKRLYQIVEERVDEMLAAGWLEEVCGLAARGFDEKQPAAKALGYGLLLRHLAGDLELAAAAAEIKKLSRRYAKRQLTWFRHMKEAHWLDIDGLTADQAATRVETIIRGPAVTRWR